MPIAGKKDSPTVAADGTRLQRLIDGVIVRTAITHSDERGEICELYDPAWGVIHDPLVFVYAATIRPGKIKGWVYHAVQTDRLVALMGSLKIVLYDMRQKSPSEGTFNEFYLGERNRALVIIPPFVAHAVQNIGDTEGVFINMPTRPYKHSDPDKYRVPKEVIRYSFEKGAGW